VSENQRQRIDLQPTLAPVAISSRVMHELCAHALQAQPEECCGLVTGSAAERFATVHRCRNEMTAKHRKDPELYPRDGTRAYFMNETDYLRAQTEAEERGETVTAVYHSHVGAGVHFSEMDQEFAESDLFPFPGAAQIVMSVWDRRVTGAGVFERDPVSGEFVGALLEVVAE